MGTGRPSQNTPILTRQSAWSLFGRSERVSHAPRCTHAKRSKNVLAERRNSVQRRTVPLLYGPTGCVLPRFQNNSDAFPIGFNSAFCFRFKIRISGFTSSQAITPGAQFAVNHWDKPRTSLPGFPLQKSFWELKLLKCAVPWYSINSILFSWSQKGCSSNVTLMWYAEKGLIKTFCEYISAALCSMPEPLMSDRWCYYWLRRQLIKAGSHRASSVSSRFRRNTKPIIFGQYEHNSTIADTSSNSCLFPADYQIVVLNSVSPSRQCIAWDFGSSLSTNNVSASLSWDTCLSPHAAAEHFPSCSCKSPYEQ